ncbi:MAG TPA: DUF2062 domain-containing protein [Micavibrio sp.]
MAILKRRNKRTLWAYTRESIWPSMGWLRTSRYFYHRMFRRGDSAYKVTAGLATGGALSFTPFLGTHLVQTLFVCWILRANMVAGVVGTIVGNPWTYPVIFYLGYQSGMWLCALFGLQDFAVLPNGSFIASINADPMAFLKYMFAHPMKLMLPLALGGYLCAGIFWFLSYIIMYYPVRRIQAAYLLKRRRQKRQEFRENKP